MRNVSIAVAVLIIVASAALAELPQRQAQWGTGPARHLMTQDEMKQWNSLQTEEEAKAFVELFWAKRDPTPNTERNELREEFDIRVGLADEHFTTKRTRGAMTDRGRALILLGSPNLVNSKGPEARATGSNARPDPAKLTWTYSGEKKPKYINRKEFEIMFIDDAADGQYQFGTTARVNPELILQEAVTALIFSPHLTKPLHGAAVPSTTPTARPATFRTSAIKEAYEQFRNEQKNSMGNVHLTWGEFVTPDGDLFTPVSLYLPASAGIEAGRKLTFFGVVENSNGEVVEVHEDTVTLEASGKDSYVDKSLQLAPGSYKATFGLAENERVLAMTKTDMTIRQLDPSESGISELILSNNAFKLPEAQKMTDPFAFGGLKVVPKGDSLFSTSDELWYFFEMRNPGIAEEGAPKVQVKIDIQGKTDQDKAVRMALPMQEYETIALKGVANHYALPMAVALKDFKPGQYTVKIRVVDTVLKKSYEFEKQFKIKL